MFLDLLFKRRSTRKYSDEKIEKEKIEKIIKSVLLSPSGRSINPWEFILVDNKELIQNLSKAKEHGSELLKTASLALVILADSSKTDVWIEDCSIAATITGLIAEDLGLGSCWVQIRQRFHNKEITSEEYVRNLLDIPENLKVECIIALGHKNEFKNSRTDDYLDYSKVKHNKYNEIYKK